MAGERQFGARREDAYCRRMRRILRRQYKRRLRQIELRRDRLHLRRRQPASIRNNRKRIAAKLAIREHVDRNETKI